MATVVANAGLILFAFFDSEPEARDSVDLDCSAAAR